MFLQILYLHKEKTCADMICIWNYPDVTMLVQVWRCNSCYIKERILLFLRLHIFTSSTVKAVRSNMNLHIRRCISGCGSAETGGSGLSSVTKSKRKHVDQQVSDTKYV